MINMLTSTCPYIRMAAPRIKAQKRGLRIAAHSFQGARKPLQHHPSKQQWKTSLTTSIRHSSVASSPTPSTTTSSSTVSPSNQPSSGPLQKLDWNNFFKLRKSRRRFNVVASVGTSAATTLLGVSILSRQDLESFGANTFFGMDPFILLGLATAGFGTVGWLAGPIFGSLAFKMGNKRISGEMAVKEKQLYERIKRFRVDPSKSSFSRPVPDFYGEKIGSLRDYRRWLKDQRAFNRKGQSLE
ncbi:MAG: TIM23 complex component [Trizodia sp. TS-e1964]|nr:MAG: TIM23 complex component [Trizodia sp. TS-e1964]